MGSIALDWTTFALEIINFLVLLWLLQRFLYRPVAEAIARRRAEIERSVKEGTEASAKAEALQAQYRDRLADWEREKAKARAQLQAEIDAERARRLSDLAAALEQERLRRDAAARREAEQRAKELERSALRQGAAFATRIAARLADPGLEARIVDLAVAELERLPAARREALHAAASADAGGSPAVISAYPLSAEQRDRLARALAEAAGTGKAPGFSVDPALLGGVRIELGPWVLGANLRDELSAFAESGYDAV